MIQVVIQPSYGKPKARRNWAATMDTLVNLTTLNVTPEVRERLSTVHPDGHSPVWGTIATHNSKMDTLREGDVVLFTGQNIVRAIGEVGVVFRDAEVGEHLWEPDEDGRGYVNVYTLRSMQRVVIPYQEIWALPGFNKGDNFQRTRFLDVEKSRTVLDGLRIRTGMEEESAERVDAAVIPMPGPTARAIEQVNTPTTQFHQPARSITVNRTEGLLVHRYTSTLGGAVFGRHSTPVGITDINVVHESGVELVEAKSSTDRDKIRQAVGQLLDYMPHCPEVTSIAVLLPHKPPTSIAEYLHRWGINMIWENPDGTFARTNAPEGNSLIAASMPSLEATSA